MARPPGGRRPGREAAATTPPGGPRRFPGFDVLAELPRWDLETAAVVNSRLGRPPALRFFTPAEEAIATALLDLLLGQSSPGEAPPEARQQTLLGRAPGGRGPGEDGRIPLTAMIDARLAEAQTDGWRYADMPEDGQAWRDTLASLHADAQAKFGVPFARCAPAEQAALIQAVQDAGSGDWRGMNAARVWSLWTRYACTAFYAHPWAWNEMGFPGPAYPRGYKNLGTGRREPFEAEDAQPADPVREDS